MTASTAQRPIRARTRTRPAPKAEPDLRQLFKLDELGPPRPPSFDEVRERVLDHRWPMVGNCSEKTKLFGLGVHVYRAAAGDWQVGLYSFGHPSNGAAKTYAARALALLIAHGFGEPGDLP